MRTRCHPLPIWWAFAVLALAGGCALEHPSVSMDSISRRPFFGFQLAPKAKPAGYHRQISQKSGEADLPKIQPAVREVESDHKWPQWLTLPSPRPVLPLPRTDLPDETRTPERVAKTGDSTPIEF
jgi:hypothetical protein